MEEDALHAAHEASNAGPQSDYGGTKNDRLKTLNVIEINSPLVDSSFLWSLHQQTTAVYSRGLKLVVVLDAAVGTLRQHFPSFSSNYLEYVWCI